MKLVNYEVFRNNGHVFVITEFENCFTVRVVGEYKEYQLNSNAEVNSFIENFNN